jgi:polyisoprenyl-phosphate glycosyltransferase
MHTSGDEAVGLISVVIPAYNEEGNLNEIYSAIRRALEGYNWELVFVDDGSRDKTYESILELAAADPRVRGLSFSRNYGHQYALLAGMRAARGDAIISMDADLQHPPALLPRMVEEWQNGSNIVHTQRIPKKTSAFKRWSSDAFYKLFSMLSGMSLDPGQSDFRLLDRKALEVIVQHDSGQLFLRGMARAIGFKSVTLPYEVGERFAGESKYTLRKMIKFAFHGITAYSTIPLRIGIFCGFVMGGLAFLELAYILFKALQGTTVPGWASLGALVSVLFGVNFILIGFLGIYVGHIFARVQHQPIYIVERTTDEPQSRRAVQTHNDKAEELIHGR